jgi:hypothetical protein
MIVGSQLGSSQQIDVDYEQNTTNNNYVSDLTLYSFEGYKYEEVPEGFYLANYRSPFVVKNQTLGLNHNLKCIDYTALVNYEGSLFVSGLYPVTDSNLTIELGLERDFWGNNINIRTNNIWLQVQKRNNNNYRLTSFWYDDKKTLNNIYFEIPSNDVIDNKIKVSFISFEENRTNTIKYNDSTYIETPYAFFESRNLPYTYLSHPIIEITPYISQGGTYCTMNIYSIQQSIPRKTITAYGNKNKTAFGLDGPHNPSEKYVLKGTNYMTENGHVGTIWADVKYMDDKTIIYVEDLLDNGWELGIHYSTQLNHLPLEEAYKLMDAEYKIISNIFSTPPTTWCSLQNQDNETHAEYAYKNLGMIWRNGKTGVSYYSNVGTFENRTWDWWKSSVDNKAIYPTFTHRLDEEVAIPYSIDFTKFKYFIDRHNDNDIQVVGFEEYYKRNINQKEASISIVDKNDTYLLFKVLTNEYPCNINIYKQNMHYPYKLIDVDDNVTINYSVNEDMSITFEAKNMHTYEFSYTVREKEKEKEVFSEKNNKNFVALVSFVVMVLIVGYLTLSKKRW